MSQTFSGGCACGAIHYEIAADPIMAGHCQCRDCQRSSGTGHGSFLAFPEGAAKISGTAKYYDVKADSGNTASRGFCPNCGSPVLAKTSGFPDMVAVTAASLDDPSKFKPGFLTYTDRAHAWDLHDSSLPHFPRMPPM